MKHSTECLQRKASGLGGCWCHLLKATKLAVGQKVVALRDLSFPGLGTVAHEGDEGTIVGAGPDAQFGCVQVHFPGMREGTALPTFVAPIIKVEPMARLVDAS